MKPRIRAYSDEYYDYIINNSNDLILVSCARFMTSDLMVKFSNYSGWEVNQLKGGVIYETKD